jgi:16S rRNA U516 pseudouridylate synthase RsuA-like enzyme
MIKDGSVKVNNDIVTNPATKVIPGQDAIMVKGRKITVDAKPHLYYFAVNKPSGYICSMVSSRDFDPDKRVVDLLNKWLAEKGAKLAKKVRAVAWCGVTFCHVDHTHKRKQGLG